MDVDDDVFAQAEAKVNADCVPIAVCFPTVVNQKKPSQPPVCLSDSGSDHAWIIKKALPLGAEPFTIPEAKSQTLAGSLRSEKAVSLQETKLPEFSSTRRIQKIIARVTDIDCRCDMLTGRDPLNTLGFDVDFSASTIVWNQEYAVPMRPKSEIRGQLRQALREMLIEDLFFANDAANDIDLFVTELKESDYHQVSVAEAAQKCKHLNDSQRQQLLHLLEKYSTTLFSGKLGKYPHAKFHLDIKPGAIPIHKRHYPVPRLHLEIFKKELQRLVDTGVLEPCGRSAWAAPTFLRQKKDGRVRWVSDFPALNRVLKRKMYPLPKIQEILARRTGYKFFTKLYVSIT